LRAAKASNRRIIRDCSRIFLIDGQQIPFKDTIVALAKLERPANPDVFGRSDAKGQDSIHFQQLRAYTLAREILAHANELKNGGPRLRVAVVGAGFSGLTAALTLLDKGDKDLHVTIFEHHRDIMPRFVGAYGRRVHPYHHLFLPSDPTRVTKSRNGKSTARWGCPVRGGRANESGGIEPILTWQPGSVEDIVDEVRRKAKVALAVFEKQGRARLHLNTKVFNIEPVLNDEAVSTIRWLDFTDARDEHKLTNGLDQFDDDVEEENQFDVVILAPGGARDAVSLVGQSNAEYWNPSRIVNAPPLRSRYEIAVIGSGNSAASEIFNYLIPDHDFVSLLGTVQAWQKGGAPFLSGLLRAAYDQDISRQDFEKLLSPAEWTTLGGIVKRDLVGTGRLMSQKMLRMTMFVRSFRPLFKEMNPVNKFLILLLAKLGYVEVRNLYDEFSVSDRSAARTYRIVIDHAAVRLFIPGRREVKPSHDGQWSQIINCSGVARSYQDAFVGTLQAESAPQVLLYRVLGRKSQVASTLRELLIAKQRVLKPKRKRTGPIVELAAVPVDA
jgi:hypothetical protein